jgi:hypothetical protein
MVRWHAGAEHVKALTANRLSALHTEKFQIKGGVEHAKDYWLCICVA